MIRAQGMEGKLNKVLTQKEKESEISPTTKNYLPVPNSFADCNGYPYAGPGEGEPCFSDKCPQKCSKDRQPFTQRGLYRDVRVGQALNKAARQ